MDQRTNITAWLAEHRQTLLRVLTRRVGCPETAADLCQETILRLLASGLWAEARDPNALAHRVARNLVIDHVRRQRTEARHRGTEPVPADVPDPAPTPEQALEAQQRLACLDEAIASLPPKCRRVFLLRRIEGLSQAAIAAMLGISINMVEKHLRHALRICQHRLARIYPGDGHNSPPWIPSPSGRG